MRAIIFLSVLPVFMALKAVQINAQPLLKDQPLPKEEGCIRMTDEKVDEIKKIVHQLTDFIDKLSDKHEDLDIRLVKLDIDKHDESATDNEDTVLELYVNDCGKRLENYYSSLDSNNSERNEEISDNSETRKNVESQESLITSENAFYDSQESASDISKTNQINRTKKNVKKSKHQVNTNDKSSTTINDSNSDTTANRKNQSTKKFNLNRKKSSKITENSNNQESTLTTKDVSDNESSVFNNNNNQTSKHVNKIKNSKGITTDDCSSDDDVTSENQSDDNYSDYKGTSENQAIDNSNLDDKVISGNQATNDSHLENKVTSQQQTTNEAKNDHSIKRIGNAKKNNNGLTDDDKFKSKSDRKSGKHAEQTITDNVSEENSDNSNTNENSDDLTNNDKKNAKKSTNKIKKSPKKQKTKTKKSKRSSDSNKTAAHTEDDSDRFDNRATSNKIYNSNKSKRNGYSYNENRLLQSLKQIIRKEIKTVVCDNDSINDSNSCDNDSDSYDNDSDSYNNDSDRHDNDSDSYDNDSDSFNDDVDDSKFDAHDSKNDADRFNDDNGKSRTHNDGGKKSKPQFILLDLDEDMEKHLKRQKCKRNGPMLVFLQQFNGQKRLAIL